MTVSRVAASPDFLSEFQHAVIEIALSTLGQAAAA